MNARRTTDEMTFEKYVVAAAFERHSLNITGERWIVHITKHVDDGEDEPTPEMSEVLQSVALELKYFLGEIPPQVFDRVLQ